MNSGFWGIFANYSIVENDVESNDESVKNEYKFSVKSFAIGPDIGFRWVDKSGINLALRIGYGIPFIEILNGKMNQPTRTFSRRYTNCF